MLVVARQTDHDQSAVSLLGHAIIPGKCLRWAGPIAAATATTTHPQRKNGLAV